MAGPAILGDALRVVRERPAIAVGVAVAGLFAVRFLGENGNAAEDSGEPAATPAADPYAGGLLGGSLGSLGPTYTPPSNGDLYDSGDVVPPPAVPATPTTPTTPAPSSTTIKVARPAGTKPAEAVGWVYIITGQPIVYDAKSSWKPGTYPAPVETNEPRKVINSIALWVSSERTIKRPNGSTTQARRVGTSSSWRNDFVVNVTVHSPSVSSVTVKL